MRMLTSLLCRRSTPKLRFNCRTIPRQHTFSTATGLYGFEHLKFPKGFQRLADDAIERSAELVEHIAMSSSVDVIRAIDEISDTVSTVFDSAELCRNTHPDRKFVEEATKASIRMRQYLPLSKRGTYSPTKLKGSRIASAVTLRRAEFIFLPEFKKIKDFKRGVCGEQYEDLEAWDEEYYTALMKSSAYDMDSLVVASYFPLPQCIEGLKVLAESLFGATLHSIPLAPGESWHPDVLKMSLHHPEEVHTLMMIGVTVFYVCYKLHENPSHQWESFIGDLGYLYLDMYSRKGKYPDCAHFAIKAGRRVSETEYQLPAVAIVCSFSALGNSSMVRLNHWELETLFHEFGHALHSLLSRTDYQNFSGSRVAFDFAETPSTLFEYYSLDYRVLRRFAKHYSTGEIIPEELVASMQGARKMFAATDLQRQTFYAAVGQTFFGEQPTPPTSSIVADLKREYTSWKHVEGTHWHTRYNHLVNYGAGYYSYLYAKCFAATIWQKLCEEDPLSLATGSA